MTLRVHLVVDAEEDLFDLHRYVARHDSPARADSLLVHLQEACASLSSLPERGQVLRELEVLGMQTYREIRCRPYRIIYEVTGTHVYVHAILDGRRSLQDLLQRRLLR